MWRGISKSKQGEIKMTEVEFIAYQIRENRIEYARLKKELMEAIDEQWTKKEWKKVKSK